MWCPQGRCTWWNPSARKEEEEEEGAEGASEAERADPETGPALLTPLSEDLQVDRMAAWTVQPSSKLMGPAFSLAVLRSNLWPGASAFAVPGRRTFDYIYLGLPSSLTRSLDH